MHVIKLWEYSELKVLNSIVRNITHSFIFCTGPQTKPSASSRCLVGDSYTFSPPNTCRNYTHAILFNLPYLFFKFRVPFVTVQPLKKKNDQRESPFGCHPLHLGSCFRCPPWSSGGRPDSEGCEPSQPWICTPAAGWQEAPGYSESPGNKYTLYVNRRSFSGSQSNHNALKIN